MVGRWQNDLLKKLCKKHFVSQRIKDCCFRILHQVRDQFSTILRKMPLTDNHFKKNQTRFFEKKKKIKNVPRLTKVQNRNLPTGIFFRCLSEFLILYFKSTFYDTWGFFALTGIWHFFALFGVKPWGHNRIFIEMQKRSDASVYW